MAGITSLTFDPLLIQACIAQIMAGHLKMQTMLTSCRPQTMQAVQTVQTEYFFSKTSVTRIF